MKYRKINPVNEYLLNNVSITRIVIALLLFTLMGLISRCYLTFFTHLKDSNVNISLNLLFLLFKATPDLPIPPPRPNSIYATGPG